MSSDPNPFGEFAISIRDLRVDYGDFVAVDDISLDIPYGEIFGLVGPNGAGKTSTFKVLATLMEPTYGEVKLAGIDSLENTERVRRVIGYMPDLAPVPSDLKLWEFLDFYADAHQLGGRGERLTRVNECLDLVNLSDKRNAWCKELSRGQTQRLVLAKTLLHRPKVLILDEPASGLDPFSRRELKLTLKRITAERATVLISSHILSELAEMCSLICVMNQGQVISSGTADQVRRELGTDKRIIQLTTLSPLVEVSSHLKTHGAVTDIELTETDCTFTFHGTENKQCELLESLLRSGIRVRTFAEKSSSFEDILVQVAEKNLS